VLAGAKEARGLPQLGEGGVEVAVVVGVLVGLSVGTGVVE
jgi:hypothetical protein